MQQASRTLVRARAWSESARAPEEHGIGRPAQPDARQCHREYQPEREGGPTENRAEHAVPNEFHEEEREACDAGHAINDVRRERRRVNLVAGSVYYRSRCFRARSAARTPARRGQRRSARNASAESAVTRLTRHASQSVFRVPKNSRAKNVLPSAPTTAPSVFTP